MNNTNQVRHFVLNGAVQTSGGTDALPEGSFALVDREEPQTGDGLKAIGSLQTKPKKQKRFILTVGEQKRPDSRTSSSDHSKSVPFSVEDVVEILAIPPKVTTSQVDEWVIGYNGHDPKTSFKFKQGMAPLRIDLRLQGGALPFSGGGNFEENLKFVYDFNKSNPYLSCDSTELCEPVACQSIVKDIVAQMKRHKVGGRELGDIIDIMPVLSCGTGVGDDEFTTWTLEVCDAGDATALARVQTSTGLPVKRTARRGNVSVYQAIKPGDDQTAPTAFTPTTGGTFPDCGICPDGNAPDETKGYVYQFLIEDNGADVSATITGQVGTATVERVGEDYGKGSYLVSNDDKLTSTQLGNISTALSGAENPFTFNFVGELKAICEGGSEDPISWTAGETCFGSSETYTITLADDECGNDRLTELQAAYPNNNVTLVAGDSAEAVIEFTSGANDIAVTVGGTTYTTTFNTDGDTTIDDFITEHESALITAGYEVRKEGSKLIVRGDSTPTNALSVTGSFEVTEVVELPADGGCQHSYEMVVPTNIICEECDDVFLDSYYTERPEEYLDSVWEKVEGPSATGDCNCGIRVKSKLYKNVPPISEIYHLPYIEDSVKIDIAASGYATEGYMAGVSEWQEKVHKQRLSKKKNRSHVAGNLICKENESYLYFQDKSIEKDYLKRQWYGKATRFSDLEAQYVNYVVKVRRNTKSGYLDQLTGKEISYNFYVEFGRHKELEGVLNEIASASGLGAVQITK